MSKTERMRDPVADRLDEDLISRRQLSGWRMVALEWERDVIHSEDRGAFIEVPYGFRVAGDCEHLEEHPVEADILRSIMRMVVDDHPLSRIAEELNRMGHRTRSGERWNPASVFRLMPVLVENGPRIFSHPDWPSVRR